MNSSMMNIAKVLKAIGHPKRLEILQLLEHSKLPVKQIQEKLGMSQTEASRHLTLMRRFSVLLCDKQRGFSFYSINPKLSFVNVINKFVKKADNTL